MNLICVVRGKPEDLHICWSPALVGVNHTYAFKENSRRKKRQLGRNIYKLHKLLFRVIIITVTVCWIFFFQDLPHTAHRLFGPLVTVSSLRIDGYLGPRLSQTTFGMAGYIPHSHVAAPESISNLLPGSWLLQPAKLGTGVGAEVARIMPCWRPGSTQQGPST